MNKRHLQIFLIVVLLGFCAIFAKKAQAACESPSYCAQPPGTCGTQCVGGECFIGNTVCQSTTTPTCECSTTGMSCGAPGQGCDPTFDQFYGISGYQGVCTDCGYRYNCGCSNPNQKFGCCTNTGPVTCCGPGGGDTCGWGSWSSCSAPCGGGTQTRYNSCTGTTSSQACNTQSCPAPSPLPNPSPGTTSPDPQICSWGGWSSCDGGSCTRSRTDSCSGATQTESCSDHPNCSPGCTTEAWSDCSATCGIGTQSRYNSCVSGGVETRACDTCDVNGCSCSVACGQSTACGTCSSSAFGQPGTVTLTPTSGNLQMPANRSVTLSWTAATKAETYDIEVFPTGTTAGLECTAANTFCATGLTGTSYTFTAPLGVANFSWRVKPNNNTCNTTTGFITATASDSYLATEGAGYNMTPDRAIDGISATAWNAGALPTHWIELDLGASRTVTGLQMLSAHLPAGNETIQIYTGATSNPTTLAYSSTTFLTSGDTLNVTFSTAQPNTRYIRIVTTASTSWVTWFELIPLYGDGVGTWTNGTFTLVGPLSGNIYLDQSATATTNLDGKCVAGPLPGQNPGAVSSIQANWISSGNISGTVTNSTFTVENIPNYGQVGLTLTPDASLWSCTCPNNCIYGQGPSGFDLHESANFYLTSVAQPWWQTRNGLLFAGSTSGNAVVSLIPSTCTGPSCVDRLSLKNSTSSSESSGIVITGGGDIDSDADSSLKYSKLRQDSAQSQVIGSTYNGPRENYQYFYNLYSMGSAPATDFSGSKPIAAPTNGRAYYVNGNTTVNISGGGWTVNSGESYVIFVNGNLTINGNPNDQLTVAEGGFLAFIVSGDVTVSNTVGRSSESDSISSIHGVYIANRIIIQGGRAGGDLRFNGEGTFVGWTGVTLGRRYATPATNGTNPIETFKFRPDFVVNVPERMTRPLYTWQETN